MDDRISILVDKEKKAKAKYVLDLKETDLSREIRKMVDELAQEFDEMMKK